MASCKDCMHEKVCDYFAGDLNEEGAEKCVCFKDRNRFVDIPFADGSVNTIYFNSKRNAETVKHIIEVDGSKPNEATVCDMQEIKHGKWVSTGNALGYTEYHCSECNNYLFLDSKDSQLYPYCPYCGAKMDSPPS